MEECSNCNRSYFKTPHTCGPPLTWPPNPRRGPIKEHTILTLAFDQLLREGRIRHVGEQRYEIVE